MAEAMGVNESALRASRASRYGQFYLIRCRNDHQRTRASTTGGRPGFLSRIQLLGIRSISTLMYK